MSHRNTIKTKNLNSITSRHNRVCNLPYQREMSILSPNNHFKLIPATTILFLPYRSYTRRVLFIRLFPEAAARGRHKECALVGTETDIFIRNCYRINWHGPLGEQSGMCAKSYGMFISTDPVYPLLGLSSKNIFKNKESRMD